MLILNEFVRTYPSIDYNELTQKLAVGTHDGMVIVYDVKGGVRLYVLQGHGQQHSQEREKERERERRAVVTACSFSPDGRRLVTTSLDEQKVVVWKISGGLFSTIINTATSSLHNGILSSHSTSSISASSSSSSSSSPLSSYPSRNVPSYVEPFRTLTFNVGDEAKMTRAATLEWVRFEWPAERTVRLRIRQSTLTFSI